MRINVYRKSSTLDGAFLCDLSQKPEYEMHTRQWIRKMINKWSEIYQISAKYMWNMLRISIYSERWTIPLTHRSLLEGERLIQGGIGSAKVEA